MTSNDPSPVLCVDLDGTLVATDTAYESLVLLAKRKPWLLVMMPFWMRPGLAHLKQRLAAAAAPDAATLPYRDEVVEAVLRVEPGSGRRPLGLGRRCGLPSGEGGTSALRKCAGSDHVLALG